MDAIIDSGNKVCRVCLGCCPQEYYSLNHGTPSYHFKLKECVPFMDLQKILDPIICVTCAVMLDRSYQLLIVARNVDSRLISYMQSISCVGACYVMAQKPDIGILKHLRYKTVVDDTYNFSMVVAMVPKAEMIEDLEESTIERCLGIVPVDGVPNTPPTATVKIEDVDQDCNEQEQERILQMPNIDSMVNWIQEKKLERERAISPSTTLQYEENVQFPLTIKNQQTCPICRSLSTNLPLHMKIHFKAKEDIPQIQNVNMMSSVASEIASTPETPQANCLQCGTDYYMKAGHKCIFSCYVRIERDRSLDTMAKTYRRRHLLKQNVIIEQTTNPFDEYVNDMNDGNEAATDIVASSSTLSALSVGDDEVTGALTGTCHKESAELTRCFTCMLQFENGRQLARHLRLRHTSLDGDDENCDNSAALIIYDEHSYAWLKSIQCWNCSQTFSSRENWLKHDYVQHKSSVFICYICFRGYKQSQIISHLTDTHSLLMRVDSFLRLIKRTSFQSATTESLVDPTYSRIAKFIMVDYELTHCPLCQRSYANSSLLLRHIVLNKCTESKCLLCQAEFQSSMHLINHLMGQRHRYEVSRANDKVGDFYSCPVCDAVFAEQPAFAQHSCRNKTNQFIIYKRRMDLWECSLCAMMSPMGIAAKHAHATSAVHLKYRLRALTSLSANYKHDLRCHLCPSQNDTFESKSTLIEHLRSVHIVGLSVLCPLCHYMALDPPSFTHHLQQVHPECLNQNVDLPKPNENCPEEFTCLLCQRKHWTLNSFWKACGQGHKDMSMSLVKALEYLLMFNEEEWLHFNGNWFVCDCGMRMYNAKQLYNHYERNSNGKASDLEDYCSMWSFCDLCGILISPKNKLTLHKVNEHSIGCEGSNTQQLKIRCKDPSELLQLKMGVRNEEDFATVEAPVLGKRKRRKTAMEIYDLDDNYKSVKKHRHNKYSFDIHLSNTNIINHPSMQPFLLLEKLSLCDLAQFNCDEINLCSSPPLPSPSYQLPSDASNKVERYVHIVETIDRVARGHNQDFHADSDDGDDASSSDFTLASVLESDDLLDDILQSHGSVEENSPTSSIQCNSHLNVTIDTPIRHNCHNDIASGYIDGYANSSGATSNDFTSIDSTSNECISETELVDKNLAERNRRTELKYSFNRLSRLLHLQKPECYRIITKKHILESTLRVVQKLRKKEAVLVVEERKWLKVVERKEAVLRDLRLQVVFGASGQKP